MPDAEQLGLDPNLIYGEEGAISMDAVAVEGDKMSFVVTCLSFQPPHVQLDETGSQAAMTEVTPPYADGNSAGVYEDTVTFDSIGPHEIICFNAITRVRESVMTGPVPAWDARSYQRSHAEIMVHEREKAARIATTTGKLG